MQLVSLVFFKLGGLGVTVMGVVGFGRCCDEEAQGPGPFRGDTDGAEATAAPCP